MVDGSPQAPVVKRPRRGAAIFFLVLVGIAAALYLLVNSRLAWEQSCAFARRELPSLLRMQVGIGRCELEPWTKTVKLYDVAVSPLPGDSGPSFAAEGIEIRVSSLQLLFRKPELDLVRIVRPRIEAVIDQKEAAPATAVGACPFDVLSKVRIRDLQVIAGDLRLARPGMQRIELEDVGVSWRQEHALAQLEVRVGGGAVALGPARELPISKAELSAVLSIDDLRLEISRAQLEMGRIGISASGNVDRLCEPIFAIDTRMAVPLDSLVEAGLLDGPASGKLTLRLGINGSSSAPSISARLVGAELAIRQYRPGDFEARLSYRSGEIKLDQLLFTAGAGTAKISGTVKLERNLPTHLKADLEGLEFGRVLEKAGLSGSWVNFFADGKVSVAGHLLPSLQLAGDAEIEGRRFSLATQAFNAPRRPGVGVLAFERGHVAMTVRFLADRVEMQRAQIESGKTHVEADATLFYANRRGLSITGRADPLDLSDFGQIAGLDADGVGSAQFDISGAYADVLLESSASFRNLDVSYFALGGVQGKVRYHRKSLTFAGLSGQKGRTPYSASGELRFAEQLHSTWDVRVAQGRIEDLIDAIAGLHPAFELFQSECTGKASGVIHLDGPASKLSGRAELALEDTRYYGRRLGDGGVVLRFLNGEAMLVDQGRLDGPFAQVAISGTYSFDGPLALKFRAEHLSLPELVGERAQQLAVSGQATLVGTVGGTSATPEVAAYLHSPNAKLGEGGNSELRLEARVVGRQLEIWGRPIEGARLSAKLSIREPYPYDASLSVGIDEVKPFLPPGAVAQGLSGSLHGLIEARGALADRRTIELQARIDRLRLSRADFSGENVDPILLSYRDGRLSVETLTLRGPNTELTMGGWLGPTELDFQMNGSFDVRLVDSFTTAVERSGGRVDISAAATGTLSDPSILGSAEIRDGRLALKDYPLAFRNLGGKIEFSEARVLVQDLAGALNDGRVSLRGSLSFKGLELETVQLASQLDEVAFRASEYLPITLSGDLSLFGKRDSMLLSGDLDVIKLRYDQPLALETVLTQFKTKQMLPGAEKKSEWLTLDVGVHAKGDVTVENNLARAKLTGDVRLTGTNASPGMIGTIQALGGSQAFFRGNQFTISQGIIDFKDRRSVDPVFDLQAETQVREYLVRLHGFGRASDPKLILSAEPALSEGDILSLLTLGITSRDKSNTAQTSAGLAAEAFFTASGLDRQVQRFLPKNPVLRDFALHVSTSYNDRSGVVEPNWQIESKFLTEQLKLRFIEPFSGRGRRAQAEYFFDNRLSAQAQWDNDDTSVQAPIGNFGLSFKLHWETD